MPPGDDVIVPLPPPARATIRVVGALTKLAVTVVDDDIVTTHGPLPMQPPPLHPAKVEPGAGVAWSETSDVAGKFSVQSAPQSMPAGDETTVPLPVPPRVTVRG
jgi:hypothetical protein